MIDGVDKKDLRRGRAAATDIVPSTSGAAQSVTEALPELVGKLDGYALRVPVVDGSIASVIAEVQYPPSSTKSVNDLFNFKSKREYNKIVELCDEEIVSADIIHKPASCIIDSNLSGVNGNLVSVAGWYDNEWGYANRLIDVAEMILGIK